MEIIIPIHVAFVLFSFYQVIVSDHYGSKWIFGKVDKLDVKKLKTYHNRVWIGLAGVILTGSLIAYGEPRVTDLLAFKIKMFFVFCLFVNSFVISGLLKLATTKKFKDLKTGDKAKILISGGVSTISWVGALICATFL